MLQIHVPSLDVLSNILMDPYLAAFLVIPIAALLAKESYQLRFSLWVVFIVYVPVGWLLVNLSVARHFELLAQAVRDTANPSQELLDNSQNDGAANVFAYYFGWAYAAIYFVVCLWAFKVVTFFIYRRRAAS